MDNTGRSAFNSDREFMGLAIGEAAKALEIGEVPIGAVIAKDGHVIARAHNRRESTYDVTAHAEILAIHEACKKLRNWRLIGCTIYVTMEPCPMCAGAMLQSRVARLVYGIKDPKAGAAGSIMNIFESPKLAHKLLITSGVEEAESRVLINTFFKRMRSDSL